MTATNIAHSRKTKLLNIVNKDNKAYQQILVRYFHERFLSRLAKSPYRERFILKGGALLYAFEEFIPRPTLDIDFMGYHINNTPKEIKEAFVNIMSQRTDEFDGVIFHLDTIDAEPITIEKEYPGIRISFDASLDSIRKNLAMDIGFGDVITPHPIDLDYPVIFEDTDSFILKAYSLETVVAEKFQTMIERGIYNSRMKDFFDLYRILSTHEFNFADLQNAISATFNNRGTTYSDNNVIFSNEFITSGNLNSRWTNYLSKMRLGLKMQFPEVVKFIISKLHPYWESLK